MSTTQGRIVRVRTFDWIKRMYWDRVWWAALDDDAQAIRAVCHAANTTAEDHGVEVTGQLSPADIEALGLQAGQVMPAPETEGPLTW